LEIKGGLNMSLFKRYLEVERKAESDDKENSFIPLKRSQEFWVQEASLHNYLLEELKKYPGQSKQEEIKKIEELGQGFFDQEGERLTFEEKQEIIQYVKDELMAYGPITPMLENPHISEIMVNNFD
jgi:pilus assembly protein CpaF